MLYAASCVLCAMCLSPNTSLSPNIGQEMVQPIKSLASIGKHANKRAQTQQSRTLFTLESEKGKRSFILINVALCSLLSLNSQLCTLLSADHHNKRAKMTLFLPNNHFTRRHTNAQLCSCCCARSSSLAFSSYITSAT